MYKILIINASHRKIGSTHILKTSFAEGLQKKAVVNELYLAEMHLEYFNYENEYSEADQYDDIVQGLFEADLIILATPIYWYSMPAKLKTVFDRFHSIYAAGKIQGLYGKKLGVIYTYGSKDDKDFVLVFEKTAKYLNIDFIGSIGVKSKFPVGIKDHDYREKSSEFVNLILEALNTSGMEDLKETWRKAGTP